MPIDLYGRTFTRTYRVLWCLDELGIEYTQLNAAEHPLGRRAIPSPELLAVNPYGKVPALVENDNIVITESLAINLYLAQQHGGDLAPSSPLGWAELFRWTLWIASEIEPLFTRRFERRFAGSASRSESTGRRDQREGGECHRRLEFLDAWLENNTFITEGRFTIADINVASALQSSKLAEIDIWRHPAIGSWLATCCSRPAWAALKQRINQSAVDAGHGDVVW